MCTEHLSQWIVTFPSYFVESSYVRYLGWFLSDKASAVRHAAVTGVSNLVALPAFASSLRPFAERNKERLLQIALEDVDHAVRKDAITGIIAPLARCVVCNHEFSDLLTSTDKPRCV